MTGDMLHEIADDTSLYTASSLAPPHGVTDLDKCDRLVDSILTSGWIGPPLVRWGDWALTGSHRIAALREILDRRKAVWLSDAEEQVIAELIVPVVGIESLFAACGLDFDEAWRDAGEPSINDDVEAIINLLPSDVRNQLGLCLR